ncbi:spindle and centriole-associated protein 1 [Stegostoma tigrinum]|uniref:spindle and centriole-associated protein 1 n=1 Tax=Stegostoma tigrinum TaxID=3053191 RepID=UPI002870B09B|nr:spindle and centriole-associated protein 1 [Stegostoma tigrinum]
MRERGGGTVRGRAALGDGSARSVRSDEPEMSLVRGSRSQAAGRGRKKTAAAPPRREWDSTISDLSVYRASPEELARRRHSRQSRNRRVGLHKPRAAPGKEPPLVNELLLDRWQLQDVLARSDRALALVRDLFADGPRLHAAFPNVTAAPGCAKAALVAPTWERPTQLSLLSESVMDSQALNETGNTTPDRPPSRDSLKKADAAAFEGSNHPSPREKPPKTPQATSAWSNTDPNQTPCTPECDSSGNHTSLNATTAIQRAKSRVQSEAEGSADSFQTETARVTQQVLHAGSRNSKNCFPGFQHCHLPTEDNNQEDKQLTLEVLQEMIDDIDQEMRELQRQTGRKVMGWLPQKGRSLTGFTFSLVSLISQLTHYLKENEIQQQQEKEHQQQLVENSTEQRTLIDALTAEFLTMQNEIISMRTTMHHYMMKTDEELHVMKQMLHGSLEAEVNKPKPRENIDPCKVGEAALGGGSLHTCIYSGRQDNMNAPITRAAPNPGDELSENLDKRLPFINQHREIVLEGAGRGQCLPEHLFGSAVLLSPPRQRNSHIAIRSQTTASLFQEGPLTDNVYLKSNCAHPSQIDKEARTSVELQRENNFIQYVGMPNQLQGQQDFAQQCNFSNANEGQRNLTSVLSVSNSSEMQQPGTVDAATDTLGAKENKMEAETADKWLKHEAMLAQMTELQLQNSTLKAQLSQFNIDKLPNSAPQIERFVPRPCDSLQQRINELNYQSAEARSKLLKLIEQQRQISGDSASPPISPIPAEGIWTETGRKSLDVLIPLPNGLDFSSESTPCPASEINSNRSTDNASRNSSSLHLDKGDGNRTSITQRLKPERLKKQGSLDNLATVLSTHTSKSLV